MDELPRQRRNLVEGQDSCLPATGTVSSSLTIFSGVGFLGYWAMVGQILGQAMTAVCLTHFLFASPTCGMAN